MAHLLKLNAGNLRILQHYERNLQDGVKLAAETIDSGKALAKQKEFVQLTQRF